MLMRVNSLTALYRSHAATLLASYARALEQAELDAVVLHSGAPQKRTVFDDQYWPLRPVPHFQHWAPIAEANCFIVVAKDGAKLYRKRVTSFWERPQPLSCPHVLEVLSHCTFDELDEVRAVLPQGRVAFVSENANIGESLGLTAEMCNPERLMKEIDPLRARKTAYEAHCLRIANEIAAHGHRTLEEAFRDGDHSELDLHLAFLKATRQDATDTPYTNIVAVAENSSILHHISYERNPRGAQSLLVDAGATYMGYCSDITRTWAKGTNEVAKKFSFILDRVEKMQQTLCRSVKLGEPYEVLHNAAHIEVANILRDAGVIGVAAQEAVDRGITRTFFPHGLGHSLGLQCHDIGCAELATESKGSALRGNFPIREGQSFTIEPGIYFIDTLLEQARSDERRDAIVWREVEQLAPLGGIRIEDDILVSGGANVIENFTRDYLPVGGANVT